MEDCQTVGLLRKQLSAVVLRESTVVVEWRQKRYEQDPVVRPQVKNNKIILGKRCVVRKVQVTF